MPDTDTKHEQLRRKYAAVFTTLEQQRISLTNVRLQDGKLFIHGAAPTGEAKDRVVEQLKSIDPRWEQEVTCDLRTETEQPPGPQTGVTTVNTSQDFSTNNNNDHRLYTVQAGDTLQSISRQFYGDDNGTARILDANRNKLPDRDALAEGQVLTIPAG